jgi:DNA-binding MarR family transcriptional regulator
MTSFKKSAPGRKTAGETSSNEQTENYFRLDLASYIPYRISILTTLMRRAIGEIYKDEPGLTEPEWKVLTTLAYKGSLPSGDVGLHMTLDRMAISRALTRLIELGLVKRKPYERDRRMSEVTLSPYGARVFDGLARQAAAISDAMLETLNRKEVAELLRLIDKLELYFRAHLNPRRPTLIHAANEISKTYRKNAESMRRGKRPVKGNSTGTTARTQTSKVP